MASNVEYRNKLYYDESIGDIADAIRSKNGSSDTYAVYQMADAIRDISFELPINTRLGCSTWSTMPSNIRVTSRSTMSYMFYNCQYLTTAPELDLSQTTNTHAMFSNCLRLASVPLYDLSKVGSAAQMFYKCAELTSIPAFVTDTLSDASNMFGQCTSLTDLPIFNFPKIVNLQNTFSGCSALTNNSLQNILKSLLTLPNDYSSTKSLYYLGLSSTQATTCTGFAEWTTLSSNGWTTGY